MAQRRRCANTPRRSSGACPNTILSFRNLHANRDSLEKQHNLICHMLVNVQQTRFGCVTSIPVMLDSHGGKARSQQGHGCVVVLHTSQETCIVHDTQWHVSLCLDKECV